MDSKSYRNSGSGDVPGYPPHVYGVLKAGGLEKETRLYDVLKQEPGSITVNNVWQATMDLLWGIQKLANAGYILCPLDVKKLAFRSATNAYTSVCCQHADTSFPMPAGTSHPTGTGDRQKWEDACTALHKERKEASKCRGAHFGAHKGPLNGPIDSLSRGNILSRACGSYIMTDAKFRSIEGCAPELNESVVSEFHGEVHKMLDLLKVRTDDKDTTNKIEGAIREIRTALGSYEMTPSSCIKKNLAGNAHDAWKVMQKYTMESGRMPWGNARVLPQHHVVVDVQCSSSDINIALCTGDVNSLPFNSVLSAEIHGYIVKGLLPQELPPQEVIPPLGLYKPVRLRGFFQKGGMLFEEIILYVAMVLTSTLRESVGFASLKWDDLVLIACDGIIVSAATYLEDFARAEKRASGGFESRRTKIQNLLITNAEVAGIAGAVCQYHGDGLKTEMDRKLCLIKGVFEVMMWFGIRPVLAQAQPIQSKGVTLPEKRFKVAVWQPGDKKGVAYDYNRPLYACPGTHQFEVRACESDFKTKVARHEERTSQQRTEAAVIWNAYQSMINDVKGELTARKLLGLELKRPPREDNSHNRIAMYADCTAKMLMM